MSMTGPQVASWSTSPHEMWWMDVSILEVQPCPKESIKPVKTVPRRAAAVSSARLEREINIAISSDVDVMLARQKGRALAAGLRFSAVDLSLIATAISELARNVIAYAERGEITIRRVERNGKSGIEVTVYDHGPGIDNLAQAVQDGYSTSGGLGLGLPGVRRLMDEFEIVSERGGGTTVTVTKWRR